MWYIKLFFLFAIFNSINGFISYNDCGYYTVEEVRVTGCKKTPCVIKAGAKQIVEVDFKTGWNIKSKQLKTEVESSVFGLRFPLECLIENACNQVGCPLSSDNLNGTLRAVLNFDNYYVNEAVTMANGTAGEISWVTKNEKGKDVICFLMLTKFVTD